MKRSVLSILLFASSLLLAQRRDPNPLYFYVGIGSFGAEGTWVPVDTNSHAAYQAETELECDQGAASCTEATADYYSGHPHISVAHFQIVKWDKNGIIASNSDGICATRTLTIGFAAKHISDTREGKVLSKEMQKSCEILGAPANEGWTLLLKNSKSWAAEQDRKHME